MHNGLMTVFAETDNNILGLLKAKQVNSQKGMFIQCIWVLLKSNKRAGIASRMLNKLIDTALNMGIDLIFFKNHPYQEDIYSFFKKNNFKQLGNILYYHLKNQIKGPEILSNLAQLPEDFYKRLFVPAIVVMSNYNDCPYTEINDRCLLSIACECFPDYRVKYMDFPDRIPFSPLRERVWIHGVPVYYTCFEKNRLKKEISSIHRLIHSWTFKVWKEVYNIPEGEFRSYGDISNKLKEGSPRAVGTAMKNNILAPHVPCHRVLGKGGTFRGFCGEKDRKAYINQRSLLECEGLLFDKNGKAILKKDDRVKSQ